MNNHTVRYGTYFYIHHGGAINFNPSEVQFGYCIVLVFVWYDFSVKNTVALRFQVIRAKNEICFLEFDDFQSNGVRHIHDTCTVS